MKRTKPSLIIFDLDQTCWPFHVDESQFKPPFKRDGAEVVDNKGRVIRSFPEVTAILKKLVEDGIELAAASRTTYPEGALSLIKLFGWEELFKYKEIYPGKKTAHFSRLREDSGLAYESMLFFDDEPRNIRDISSLGVTAFLIDPDQGVCAAAIEKGFKEFVKKNAGQV